MNTKNELTATEIQNEINSELSNLVKTSFNSDYENKLTNLINHKKEYLKTLQEKGNRPAAYMLFEEIQFLDKIIKPIIEQSEK